MARQNALNIFDTNETKAKLAEEYGKVIENVQKNTISNLLKNQNLSGDPKGGSVEAERIANTDSADYGTARSGGSAQAVVADPVTINIDTDKELINEVEEKDLALFGVDGLIARKTESNRRSMQRELERAFFSVAGTAATEVEKPDDPIDQLEALIQAVETVKNDFVDGVERDLINVIATPAVYGKWRKYLDDGRANVETDIADFGAYHGVNVFSSVYLPDGVDAIAMCEGAVAQPVLTSLDEAGKIPLSDAYHFGMFYYYGTKAVMPDLIFKMSAGASI